MGAVSPRSRIVFLAWAAPLAVAVAVRAYGIEWGLPDLYEEARPFFEAWEMWGWGRAAGFDPDPGFYRYPSLVFYLQWLVQAVPVGIQWLTGGAESLVEVPLSFYDDRTPFLLAGRIVTATFGVALVLGCYALGRRLAGVRVGAVAALLAAVNGFLVEHSQYIEVDTPLACFSVWALWAMLRILERPTPARSLLAGLLLGLAASAKYTGAVLFVPLVVTHGIVAWRAPGRALPRMVAAVGGAGLVAALVFALTSPFVLLSWEVALEDILSEGRHMRTGHLGAEAGLGWWVYTQALGQRVLGWPALLSALAAAVLLVRRRSAEGLVLGSFLLVYLGGIGSWEMRADRYLGPAVPGLIVLAAVPVGSVAGRRWPVPALLAVVLTASSAVGLPVVWERMKPDTRGLAREWIETAVPAGAFLVMEPWGPDLLEPIDIYDLPMGMRQAFLDRTSRKLYAVQSLPLVPTRPELTAIFYDLEVHTDADVVVLSSDVSDRYRADPERFRAHVSFYEQLAATAPVLAEFGPEQGKGPTITIHAPHPKLDVFSRRAPVGPAELPRSEPELEARKSIWYGKLALNYETFGYVDEAIRCYELSASTDAWARGILSRAARGVARCHLQRGDPPAAERAVDAMARRCPYPDEIAEIEQLLTQLRRAVASADTSRTERLSDAVRDGEN